MRECVDVFVWMCESACVCVCVCVYVRVESLLMKECAWKRVMII